MIDFACKQFNIKDIIKCSLGLTRAEIQIFEYLLKNSDSITSEKLAAKLKLDQSTTQRALKKLTEKNIALRKQKNLSGGGYIYEYERNDKNTIRKIIMNTINNWTSRVDEELKNW